MNEVWWFICISWKKYYQVCLISNRIMFENSRRKVWWLWMQKYMKYAFVRREKRKSCTLLQENIQFHTVQTDSISSVSWHPGNKERVSLKPNNLECWNMMQWVSPILPVTIMKFKTGVSKNWCKKGAVPLPPKHLTWHMHVVRFRFCSIGQMRQLTVSVLER